MTSLAAEANSPFSDFDTPGTPTATVPATPRTSSAATRIALPPRPLRLPGRCRSGRSWDWGGGVAAPDPAGAAGLWREKFMEGLPFIVRQGAEVSVEGQSGDFEGEPGVDQPVLQPEQVPLEVDQVR